VTTLLFFFHVKQRSTCSDGTFPGRGWVCRHRHHIVPVSTSRCQSGAEPEIQRRRHCSARFAPVPRHAHVLGERCSCSCEPRSLLACHTRWSWSRVPDDKQHPFASDGPRRDRGRGQWSIFVISRFFLISVVQIARGKGKQCAGALFPIPCPYSSSLVPIAPSCREAAESPS
jgi:hypothetical protein